MKMLIIIMTLIAYDPVAERVDTHTVIGHYEEGEVGKALRACEVAGHKIVEQYFRKNGRDTMSYTCAAGEIKLGKGV